jgi:hypothetical protein
MIAAEEIVVARQIQEKTERDALRKSKRQGSRKKSDH